MYQIDIIFFFFTMIVSVYYEFHQLFNNTCLLSVENIVFRIYLGIKSINCFCSIYVLFCYMMNWLYCITIKIGKTILLMFDIK